MGEGEKAVATFERCKQLRSPWEALLQECYDYTMPHKESLFVEAEGQRKTTRIYDETAVVGVQEFANRIQDGMMPPFQQWAMLVAGSDVPQEERPEVNASLSRVNAYIMEAIGQSSAASEINEALLDCAVSVGGLEIRRGTAVEPLSVRAIPMSRLFIDNGPSGRVDTICMVETLRADKIEAKWPKAKLSDELRKRAADAADPARKTQPEKFVVMVQRVYGPDEAWTELVVHHETKHVIHRKTHQGIGSCPYIVFRWAKLAGETWGRGPVVNVLPAIKTVNLTMELILENAEFAITGLYQAEDDGIINPDTIQIVPGTIVPHAPGSEGLRRVETAGDFDVGNLILAEMRQNIRRGLYNEQMGNQMGGKTPISAQEVAERQADLARMIGASFARIVYELVNPFITRVAYVLREMGLIDLPAIDGRTVRVLPKGPLARAQHMQHISAFGQWANQYGSIYGPEALSVASKREEVGPWLAEMHGVPADKIRTAQEQQQLIEQQQEAMQQQGAMGGPQQG